MMVIVALIETKARRVNNEPRRERGSEKDFHSHVGSQREARHVDNGIRNVRYRERSLDEVVAGRLSLREERVERWDERERRRSVQPLRFEGIVIPDDPSLP